ncbi:hypothetical protein [Leucobacter denitrificans]|uniref:DUF559 domain-containing protein n=1 Tax=Leucobacter denitrificans TaxID=683042 RepID=A0A7G9S201_9MICO|nr:hypothetical protein [Leucobacter denitrificans]QNN61876.1 hypothetical protein H9L06_05930 [Leucobacter denitrificans]
MRPLPPIVTSGPIARVADLRASGVPHHRLYASDQARTIYGIVPAPGVDPDAFTTRVAAAKLLLKPGSFLSRRTAAKLYDLPEYGGDGAIDVGVHWPTTPPRRVGISPHRVREGCLLQLPSAPDWLPVPADVWALLAAVLTVDQLIAVGDALISGLSRRSRPLSSLEELEAARLRFSGCAGSQKMRVALPLLRTGVESPSESQLRLHILRAGFPDLVTCCPVPTNIRLFHSDLGYPQWKIACEYEGEYHFTGGVEQARRDVSRREAMVDAGWIVLQATARDLRDPREYLGRLAHAIYQRTHAA